MNDELMVSLAQMILVLVLGGCWIVWLRRKRVVEVPVMMRDPGALIEATPETLKHLDVVRQNWFRAFYAERMMHVNSDRARRGLKPLVRSLVSIQSEG